MKGPAMYLRLVVLVGVLAIAALAFPAAEATKAASSFTTAAPTLTVRGSQWGRIVFDQRGRALYAFTSDTRARSTCYGACAAAWPPYLVRGKIRAGAGTRRALLRTTRRRDGSRQATYNGWPLYYYVGDRRPGEVRCQNVLGFGGLWLVVRPNGRLVR